MFVFILAPDGGARGEIEGRDVVKLFLRPDFYFAFNQTNTSNKAGESNLRPGVPVFQIPNFILFALPAILLIVVPILLEVDAIHLVPPAILALGDAILALGDAILLLREIIRQNKLNTPNTRIDTSCEKMGSMNSRYLALFFLLTKSIKW